MRSALLAVAAWLIAVPAWAAPTSDPEAWADSFLDAAKANNTAKLTEVVTSIANARLPKDKIAESIKGVTDHFAGKVPSFGEQFSEQKTGTFLIRYRFAFGYPDQFLFYGIDLVRSSDAGWELFNLKMTTNLNELLTDPYPFK